LAVLNRQRNLASHKAETDWTLSRAEGQNCPFTDVLGIGARGISLQQHCSCCVAKLNGSGPGAVNPANFAPVFRKEVDILQGLSAGDSDVTLW